MTLLLLGMLGAAVVAFVLYPVFARREELAGAPSEAARELERLAERKEQIYSAIKDIDFEHRAGKLSEADYQSARAEFLSQAAKLILRMEKLEGSEKTARDRKGAAAAGSAPLPEPARVELKPVCPGCGQSNPEGARFCFRCGTKVELASACPQCGARLPAEVRFCADCGVHIPA